MIGIWRRSIPCWNLIYDSVNLWQWELLNFQKPEIFSSKLSRGGIFLYLN